MEGYSIICVESKVTRPKKVTVGKATWVDLPCTTITRQTRVKTNLRNRLSAKTLNHLLVIAIEGPAPTDYPYDRACNLWASWQNRRIQVDT